MSRLLTDIPNEIDKYILPDGDYDITGLLQAQRDLTAEIVRAEERERIVKDLEELHRPDYRVKDVIIYLKYRLGISQALKKVRNET